MKAKPFEIPKRWVWEAYQQVKRNDGAAGIDQQTMQQFERNLSKKPVLSMESFVVGKLLPASS